MTDKEKQILINFFELKAKQLICKLWLLINQQPGYTQDDIYLLEKVLTVQSKLDKVEDELLKLLTDNESFIGSLDLDDFASRQEFKVSFDEQKEFSKEMIGYETTIDKLFEALERKH